MGFIIRNLTIFLFFSPDAPLTQKEMTESGIFKCHICSFEIPYSYYKHSDFQNEVKYSEKLYMIDDPGEFGIFPLKLPIGSECKYCKRTICLDKSCSKFDRHRICVNCDR